MKPIALTVAIAALVLAGCGDKDAGTETAGSSFIDKATQAARDTADAATEQASDMADASGDLLDKAKETTGEAMADAGERLKEAASGGTLNTETAMATAGDTAARVAEDAKALAADRLATATGTGTEAATSTAAAAAVAATEPAAGAPAADLALGEKIYKGNCFACHGTGAAGAPKAGDAGAWSDRIAKGDATLIKHAIEGFKGSTGYMPPKGGFSNLSDDEVAAAVHYMVAQSR